MQEGYFYSVATQQTLPDKELGCQRLPGKPRVTLLTTDSALLVLPSLEGVLKRFLHTKAWLGY